MKFIKRSFAFLIALFLVGILLFNVQLYYTPSFISYGPKGINQDLLFQLRHLKDELHHGAANDMQSVYPEGFVFLNALYGLSWMEIADASQEKNALSQEAYEEIDWVLSELNSRQAHKPFDPFLNPPYGIFYKGWYNYILGRKINSLPEAERDSVDLTEFRQNCEVILQSLSKHSGPYLESYKGACWPADMFVAMASVALYNQLDMGVYQTQIEAWLEKVESLTDKHGLVPHSCNCATGKAKEAARGSSQSLIQVFLREIDPIYAQEKFNIYKELFVEKRLGLPGIREYPKGSSGNGDIDSGPVIWGIGGAASIVGQRAMALHGESTLAIGLRNSIEAFGLGNSSGKKKKYLFGALPIADAFIAWSNSTEAQKVDVLTTEDNWRKSTQFLSLFLLILGGLGLFFILRKK